MHTFRFVLHTYTFYEPIFSGDNRATRMRAAFDHLVFSIFYLHIRSGRNRVGMPDCVVPGRFMQQMFSF